jgi:4-hydroxybutyryl-CoA dehydratase/vinylacetyl-CoA-Delta-isomerase
MLMTGEQYIESLRKLNTRVYLFGEKIENWVDHPMIRPSQTFLFIYRGVYFKT